MGVLLSPLFLRYTRTSALEVVVVASEIHPDFSPGVVVVVPEIHPDFSPGSGDR
jgi:hypothetical protein